MCSPKATILHADLDAFYASVEQRDAPHLRGKPMCVGAGVVLAASYEARAMGVRTAMNLREARRLCPTIISVPPRMEAYSEASKQVFSIFDDTTPLVEPISIDEAFLDVGGLLKLVGPPVAIASQLRTRVANEVGLAISVGVARTKFLAKVASGVCKPNGLLVVEPDEELAFLHPLPVGRLWGVGVKTAAKLNAVEIYTVGQVANLDEGQLTELLGRGAGRHIHALAHNIDARRVVTGKRRSSIGSQQALAGRARSHDEIEAVLLGLVDRVSRRLRDGHRVGRTVTLRFRFGDFVADTRSHTLRQPTGSTAVFLDAARALLEPRRAEIERRKLTLIGVTIANLSSDSSIQQVLPLDDRSSPQLDAALDSVRHRFGSSSIGRAKLVGTSPGLSVPLLPDPVLPGL
ncbi:MAG: DNA polymerase IV [Acidimicrobiales bacterium]